MYFIKFFILLICVELFQLIATSNADVITLDNERYPIVNVSQGQLQGLKRTTSKGKTFYSFKGIPYAEPPIGNLRFRDPVAIGPWAGVRNAFEDINICSQIGMLDDVFRGDEDCLYLNVYTPNIPSGGAEKYPVVIYIHGGGFIAGSGSEFDAPPNFFVENDILLVAINYRLDIFGFLSLDIPEVPGNAALKDQHLAIKWVNENIERFGGDKDNITLQGASAGSVSVEYQMLTSNSQGLFHRTSMQSGGVLASWSRPRSQEKSLEKLINIIGSSNESHEILENLSLMTTENILQIAGRVKDTEVLKSGLIFTAFAPVVEKIYPNVEAFITNDPLEVYKSGDYVKVPVLMTFCRDEGVVFPGMYGESLTSEILNRQYADFMEFVTITDKDSVNGNMTAVYSNLGVSDAEQMDEFISDLMFVVGINQALKYIVKDNANEHYSYLFSFVGTLQIPNYPAIEKSMHGADMMYLIFFPESLLSEEELRLKQYLNSIYTNFIKYGKPSAPNTVWNPITEASFNVLNIQGVNNSMESFPFADRMNYWDTLFV